MLLGGGAAGRRLWLPSDGGRPASDGEKPASVTTEEGQASNRVAAVSVAAGGPLAFDRGRSARDAVEGQQKSVIGCVGATSVVAEGQTASVATEGRVGGMSGSVRAGCMSAATGGLQAPVGCGVATVATGRWAASVATGEQPASVDGDKLHDGEVLQSLSFTVW